MGSIGHVESLWRYPVKSMRGQEIREAFLGFAGVYGDRHYAFRDVAAPKGFPFLTGREQEAMLLYQPRFRHPDRAAEPPNLEDADGMAPGMTPIYASATDLMVDVEAPSGKVLAVDDPALIEMLSAGLDRKHALSLLRSDRAVTDCRPVSVFSIQTVKQLGDEIGLTLDKRRFRANIYATFGAMSGFAEDAFIGRRLQIGTKAVIAVMDRDPRCKMITLDPDTAEARPEVLRRVAQAHDGKAGLYGAVLVEGTVRSGDEIVLLD
jgi:uncharacterized protein